MDVLKLTDWFPADVEPVHPGAYETTKEQDRSPTFQFWNGRKWGAMAFNAEESVFGQDYPTVRPHPRWRGLANKP